MPELYQLSYVSTRPRQTTDEEIVNGIVLPAMAKNRRLDLTGCLWFDSSHFLQILEGPKSSVLEVFDAIMADGRHTHVEVLSQHPIEMRSFERFSMRSIAGCVPDTIARLFEARDDNRNGRRRMSIDIEPLVPAIVKELSRWPMTPAV